MSLALTETMKTDLVASDSRPILSEQLIKYLGPRREKTCLGGVAHNKGADQPAHPCRLISAFVIYAYWKVSYLDMLQAKFKISR